MSLRHNMFYRNWPLGQVYAMTNRCIQMMRKSFRRAFGSAEQASARRRAMRGEEGAELVEFALTCMLLLTVIFGITELCIVFFSYSTAAEASRNTARWLATQGTSSCTAANTTCIPSASAIASHVQAIPGAAQMNATVQWCATSANCSTTATTSNAAQGDIVQVQVQYTYASVPFVAPTGLTATSTSQMTIWQ